MLDELLRVQLVLRMRKMERLHHVYKHLHEGDLPNQFIRGLPFDLTAAQQRTIAEVSADLESDQLMHRLFQGDVGAGKTLVAMYAMLVAVADGHQGALMAPTEVLADSNHLNLFELAKHLEVSDNDADRKEASFDPTVDQWSYRNRSKSDSKRNAGGLS